MAETWNLVGKTEDVNDVVSRLNLRVVERFLVDHFPGLAVVGCDINVHVETEALVDDLVNLCDDYGIEASLI